MSANVSAGQIYTGSGVDSVIITGSLVGGATIRLDNADGSEEAADSITVGNISSGVVYGESGADSFNISGDARKASIFGGGQNDSVTIGGSLSSALIDGEGGPVVQVRQCDWLHRQGRRWRRSVSASGLIAAGLSMAMVVMTLLKL